MPIDKAGAHTMRATDTTLTNLTATAGTADKTIADVTATYSQAILNDNFRDIATDVNQIKQVLRDLGFTL